MAVDSRHPKLALETASLTDVGLLRANNEDSYLYWQPASEEELRRKGHLAIVADGMGGYDGGQEASRLAVETVRHIYDTQFNGDPQATLVAGLIAAHQTIQRYAEEHAQFSSMGTTCTAVAIVNDQLYFAHIGDSRLYLCRNTTISRLTRDHSYVGRLVENGIVRSEDAESHPQRHILTAALGSGREVMPDVGENPTTLQDGDSLVLCTDGLWSVAGEQEITRIVQSHLPMQACQLLVQTVLQHGAPDNVTVMILRISIR